MGPTLTDNEALQIAQDWAEENLTPDWALTCVEPIEHEDAYRLVFVARSGSHSAGEYDEGSEFHGRIDGAGEVRMDLIIYDPR